MKPALEGALLPGSPLEGGPGMTAQEMCMVGVSQLTKCDSAGFLCGVDILLVPCIPSRINQSSNGSTGESLGKRSHKRMQTHMHINQYSLHSYTYLTIKWLS